MTRLLQISLSGGIRRGLALGLYFLLTMSMAGGSAMIFFAAAIHLQLTEYEVILGENITLFLPIELLVVGLASLILPLGLIAMLSVSRTTKEEAEANPDVLSLVKTLSKANLASVALLLISMSATIALVVSAKSFEQKNLGDYVDKLFNVGFMRVDTVTSILHRVQTEFECCGPSGPADFQQYLPTDSNGLWYFPYSCCDPAALQCRRHEKSMMAGQHVNDTTLDYEKAGLMLQGCRQPFMSLFNYLTSKLSTISIALMLVHLVIPVVFRYLQTSMLAALLDYGDPEAAAFGCLFWWGTDPKPKETEEKPEEKPTETEEKTEGEGEEDETEEEEKENPTEQEEEENTEETKSEDAEESEKEKTEGETEEAENEAEEEVGEEENSDETQKDEESEEAADVEDEDTTEEDE